ncbi:START domain containing 14 [Corythoichthys intestinalis]|uniref:START domain containing 14 n=1 Tax=Corythoichthys intestinalis TaxID=161448 RepID=UPI0025A568B8|nr:START domain containing 14 [Corythoichthys intestinalis]XP_061793225.1 START domain-containing protein 10-like [Nerophis lumbriciformis]
MSFKSIIPDSEAFDDFRSQCLSTENWQERYNKGSMQVWMEVSKKKGEGGPKVHKIKCKNTIKDVSAETMYDVIHDSKYRKTWDKVMLKSQDIAKVSACADIGYYAWNCPKPIKNRDVVTLRTWRVTDDDYSVINFSVKHPEYPPIKEAVRAVSILTGYYIKPTGPNSCIFIYLSQADPRGSLPKWLVKKVSEVMAPSVLKDVHKAGQRYPSWKAENCPEYKPWRNPTQCTLPMIDPSILAIQRCDSLENVDESGAQEQNAES